MFALENIQKKAIARVYGLTRELVEYQTTYIHYTYNTQVNNSDNLNATENRILIRLCVCVREWRSVPI